MLNATLLRDSWRHWWSPEWYRGSVGPRWLPWVWTFVFNTGIALALTVIGLGFGRKFDLAAVARTNFVVAQAIGFSIHILFRLGLMVLGPERLDRFSTPQRALFYSGIPILGVLIGYVIGLSLLGVDVQRLVFESPRVVLQIIFFSVLISAFWYRYTAMKCASLLRETLWSMVSEIHSTIDFDYAGYTAENLARFERAYDLFEQDR